MIYDTLSRLGTYSSIPFLNKIARLVSENTLVTAEQGSTPLIGDDVVLKKSRYAPVTGSGRFEAHREYADLQIVLAGQEILRTVFPADATRITEYDAREDAEFFAAERNTTEFLLREGRFIYLAPGEIHRPGCACGESSGDVVKCVLKIRCR